MTSNRSNNFVYIGPNAGDPTSIPLLWTQDGSIVFPAYSAIPISSGLISVRNENVAATTSRKDMSSPQTCRIKETIYMTEPKPKLVKTLAITQVEIWVETPTMLHLVSLVNKPHRHKLTTMLTSAILHRDETTPRIEEATLTRTETDRIVEVIMTMTVENGEIGTTMVEVNDEITMIDDGGNHALQPPVETANKDADPGAAL
uniref:Uncharacterized protein n=2 Tax=Oryza sativa subsp. japonica TaxID=39947 RepID=A0A5S6R7A8_ORYSJ|nr:hypothetical protein [Oryza sativa Japonica Group]ABA91577.2 hypothetical protein LOC_Os11g06080 [Oryza sativa Japonica Group]